MKTNLSKIGKSLNKAFRKTSITVKKHAPEIAMIGGTIATVAGTIAACNATLKVDQLLEEDKESLEKIHEAHETISEEKYSQKDYVSDLTKTYIHMSGKVIKLYAPAVILEGLGLVSMFASNKMLKKRCSELGAAYATVKSMFDKYRANVRERYGEEVDHEMRYGIKKQQFEETVVDANGKEKTKKVTKNAAGDIQNISDYARYFDETCTGYRTDTYGNPAHEENMYFLKCQQRSANERFKRQGYLFLNDVYKMLGFEPTKAGNIVGWVLDETNENIDNFIDFGIYKEFRANRRFVNGYEEVILLDFNVDGPILDSDALKIAKI